MVRALRIGKSKSAEPQSGKGGCQPQSPTLEQPWAWERLSLTKQENIPSSSDGMSTELL